MQIVFCVFHNLFVVVYEIKLLLYLLVKSRLISQDVREKQVQKQVLKAAHGSFSDKKLSRKFWLHNSLRKSLNN